MLKINAMHKIPGSYTLRLGLVLVLLASLVVFATASAGDETWSALGEGMNADVYALAFDSAGTLFAGGSFTKAGAGPANRIAQWNGSEWLPLGSGLNSEVCRIQNVI